MIFEAISFMLSGFFMKASDELMDEKNNTLLSIISGILCVVFTLWVSTVDGDATCIFLSILIGTLLASKIDSISHILSAIMFIVLLFILGFPEFSWICLILCTIAIFIDEKGNDISDKKEMNKNKLNFLETFFKYRYLTKITVLIFSLLGLIQVFHPSFLQGFIFFKPITIVYFYLFDLSYEFVGFLFNRFDNVF